jgi:hypothetical protein
MESGKLKILWLTIDRSKRIFQNFDYFREELEKVADLDIVWKYTDPHRAGYYSKLCMKGKIPPEGAIPRRLLEKDYDVLVTDALFAYMNEGIEKFRCPKAFISGDLHRAVPKWQIDSAVGLGFTIHFAGSWSGLERFHPDKFKVYQTFWSPLVSSTRVFNREGAKKVTGVIGIGSIGPKIYPHRDNAAKQLEGWKYFRRIYRPLDADHPESDGKPWPVGKDYAKVIKDSWLAITGGSIFDYAVGKYFEIAGCGTAIMTNWFKDLKRLGFRRDVNLFVYQDNVRAQVKDLLANKEKIKAVSFSGYKLMMAKHTAQKRASQFVKCLHMILGGEYDSVGVKDERRWLFNIG